MHFCSPSVSMSITTEKEVQDIFSSILRPLNPNVIENGSIFGSLTAPHMGQMYAGENGSVCAYGSQPLSEFITGASLIAPGPPIPTERPSAQDATVGFFADGEFAANSFINRCLYLSTDDVSESSDTFSNPADENMPPIENIAPQKLAKPENTPKKSIAVEDVVIAVASAKKGYTAEEDVVTDSEPQYDDHYAKQRPTTQFRKPSFFCCMPFRQCGPAGA